MRQQINLYQPIFSEARKSFSAATFGIVLLILIAALAAFSVSSSMRVEQLAIEVEALRAQQAEQENTLGAGAAESSETVEARVKQLDRLVSARGRALEVLQSGAAGTTAGFAPRLEALARRHVEGLWIDSMQMSGANGAMTLAGASFNPDIVPMYLRSLAQDKVLAGTRFDDFIIERPTTDTVKEESEDSGKKSKRLDPKLVRFRAGSASLKQASKEASS